MKYPSYLHGSHTFMTLPKSYQEYFIRWYYYDNTDEEDIPGTIPVEHIEDYITNHCNAQRLWCAKGFAIARNCDTGDNFDFVNDSEFLTVVHYVAELWYKMAVDHEWIKPDISKDEFEKECGCLSYGGSKNIRL